MTLNSMTGTCLYLYRHKQLTEGDVFIGYDKDTAASVILQVTEELATRRQQQPQSLDDESEEEYPERINEEEVEVLLISVNNIQVVKKQSHNYINICYCVTYKNIIYNLRKVFLKRFCLLLLH